MNKIVFCIAALALSACASTSANQSDGRTSTNSAIEALPNSGLGPQRLEPGECGLFLWSKTDTTKFIFFSRALSGTALFKPASEALTLSQTGASGDIFGQFNTSLQYNSPNGNSVDLTYRPGEALDGGQRIEDGLLTLTDRAGWRTKLPVLGVRACQPE